MSRKKRILFISLIVLVLVSFMLTIFVFLAVKETKINFSTAPTMEEKEVIDILNHKKVIPYGISTLFISRSDVQAKVEMAVPKLKVQNIEVEFPNILKINCEERQEVFYIAIDNKAFVLDAEMKIVSVIGLNEAIERNFIKLNIDDNLKMNESDWCLGKKITMQYLTQVLSVINAIIDYYSRNSYVQILCNHYKEINVYETYSIENNTKFLSLKFVTSSGKLIIIKNPTIEMDTRIGKLIAITGDSSVNQDEIEIIYFVQLLLYLIYIKFMIL